MDVIGFAEHLLHARVFYADTAAGIARTGGAFEGIAGGYIWDK